MQACTNIQCRQKCAYVADMPRLAFGWSSVWGLPMPRYPKFPKHRGGLLPYSVSQESPQISGTAPYHASLDELVCRMGTSTERLDILSGYVAYRRELKSVGIIKGFQWVNGSFLEETQRFYKREPADIDVVTFFRLPEGVNFKDLKQERPDLFDSDLSTAAYRVDTAMLDFIDQPFSDSICKTTAYYHGLWSFQNLVKLKKAAKRKGYVEIDLLEDEDPVDRRIEELRSRLGGG